MPSRLYPPSLPPKGVGSSCAHVAYADALSLIRCADILLWQPARRGLIARIGRGKYTHVEMVVAAEPACLVVGALQWQGIRVTYLSDLVAEPGGQWDVFRVRPPEGVVFYPDIAAAYMRSLVGQRYGWRDLFRAVLVRLPLVRVFVPADVNDLTVTSRPPFCSQAVSRSLAAGGLDPVQFCAHRATGPNDLARSAVLEYQYTIALSAAMEFRYPIAP